MLSTSAIAAAILVRTREPAITGAPDAHLDHLVAVAQVAAREEPELAQKFVWTRQASTYLGFRAAARGMEAEARVRKELPVKHGLSVQVLDNLTQTLDQFDAAMAQGSEGRRAHVGASAELATVANEIVQAVRVMDGLNRFRFAGDPESLAAWESASNIAASPPPTASSELAPEGAPPTAGEIRPAREAAPVEG